MSEENTLPQNDNTPTGDSYEQSIDSNNTEARNEEFMGFGAMMGMEDIQADQAIVGSSVDQFRPYTMQYTDIENRYRHAALNQSGFSAIGQGLQRGIFGEIVGGTLEGFGALGNLMMNGGEYNNYSERNFLESLGNAIREGQDENTQIFEENAGATFAFGDAGWWGKNLPSMLSAVSMMIPGAAAGKAASAAGKAIAKAAGTSAKAAAKIANASSTLGGAVAMRHAENIREAHGAFEEAREAFLNDIRGLQDFKGTEAWQSFAKKNGRQPKNKYELADFIGGVAAKRAYAVNSANIAFDLIQMHGLTKALRGTRGALTGARAAKAAGKEVTRKQMNLDRLSRLSNFVVKDMATEGVEEAVNFVGTEEGKYLARVMAGQATESDFGDRVGEYLKDDHFWESAFLGALGGAVFTGATNGIRHKATSKAQKASIERAENRKEGIKKAAETAKMAEDPNVPTGIVQDAARRQFYNIGLEAAMSGQADVAEKQLAVLAEEMSRDGASQQEIDSAMEMAREQFALAETAVGEANMALAGMNLSPEEAGTFRMMAANNAFQQAGVAKMREELAPEIANVRQAEDHKAASLRELRGEVNKALENKDLPKPERKKLERQKAVIEDLMGNPQEGDVQAMTDEELTQELNAGGLEGIEEGRQNEIQEEIKKRNGLGKTDERVALDTALEVEQQTLKEERADLSSAEGVEFIKEVTAKAEENKAKKEQEEFDQWLANTADPEELSRAAIKEDDPVKKKAIEDKLEQIERGEINRTTQTNQERSKDIPVPTPVQAKIDELLENSEHIKLDENGEYYVDGRTGQRYMRTTTWMNGGQAESFNPSNAFAKPSSNIGNSVDEYVRDFFAGELRNPEAYPHITEEQMRGLSEQLAALEQEFIANGEKVIAKDVVVFNDMEVSDDNAAGVAGTVDLLTVDKDGNFRVYDMKTIRNATKEGGRLKRTTNPITGESQLVYNAANEYGRDLAKKHQKQLSAYRLMLMNQLGVNVPEVGIIPIEVKYKDPRNVKPELRDAIVADEANYLGEVLYHMPSKDMFGLTEPEVEGIVTENEQDGPEDGTPEETPDVVTPATNITVESGAVTVPVNILATYFASQLKVMKEPGREDGPYLVHAADGPIQLGDSNVAAKYAAVQSILNGTNSAPITFRIAASNRIVDSVSIWSKLDTAKESGLLEATDAKGNHVYRPGVGDSLAIEVVVGDVVIGELPSTAELMNAAQMQGQAANTTNKMSRDKFEKGSRAGRAPLMSENTMMTLLTQEAHLQNAIQMHALRDALYKAHKEGTNVFAANITGGKDNFGNNAMGGLIYSTGQGVSGHQIESVGQTIRKHGYALMLNSAERTTMQLSLNGNGGSVAPYQSNNKLGSTDLQNTRSLSRYNSGALYVPLDNGGEIVYVKVPNRTMSDFRNSEEILEQINNVLNSGNDQLIYELQNILGSRALRQTEEGDWALYETNQSGVPSKPLSIRRNTGWTQDISAILPNMNFNIAVNTDSGLSAFEDANLPLTIGAMQWGNMSEFIADQVSIGYEPVLDSEGEVMGWTHPLAPAYANNDAQAGVRFQNADTHATQMVLQAKAVAEQAEAPKVDGSIITEALLHHKDQAIEKDESIDLSWMKDVEGEFPDDMLFFTAAAAEAANNNDKATAEDMAKAEEWFKKNLPNVPFKRVKGMIKRNGTLAYGIFEAGAVEVSNLGVVGTEYHEAFHAVTEMLLEDKRKEKLFEYAADKYKTKDDVELNERLAEDFREYMLTKGLSNQSKSPIRRFFSELLELINAIMSGDLRATRLFQQINAGKFANTSPRVRQYATRNKLIMADIPEYNSKVQAELAQNIKNGAFRALRAAQSGKGGPKVLEAYEELKRLNGMTTKEMRDAAIIYDNQTKSDALARVLVKMGMMSMKQSAMAVLRHNPDSKELAQKFTDLFQTNAEQVQDYFSNRPEMVSAMKGLMDQEFTAGTVENEQYNESFDRMNPKDSLSQTVRSLIETTPLITADTMRNMPQLQNLLAAANVHIINGNLDKANEAFAAISKAVGVTETKTYFGLPQTMNVDLEFPYLSQLVSNKPDLNSMLAAMDDAGAVYPEYRLLAARLRAEPSWVQSQFFSGMRKGSTAELSVKQTHNGVRMDVTDVFSMTLYTHNNSSIRMRIRDMAMAQGITEAELAKKVAKRLAENTRRLDSMSNEQFVQNASAMLQFIGFSTLDPQAAERTLEYKANDTVFRKNLYEAFEGLMVNYSRVASANEKQIENAEKELTKRMILAANMFAPYDKGAISTTFQNVQDSRIYSKQVPSFITEWFDQFEQGKLTNAEFEQRLRDTVFRDRRMFATNYGKLLFPYGPDKAMVNTHVTRGALRAFRVGGFESGQAKYTDMTDAQWFEFQLRAMMKPINGMYYLPITTPSDASNSYMVPAVKYSLDSKYAVEQAKMHLRQTIEAEFFELQNIPGTFANAEVDKYMRSVLQRTNENGRRYQIKDTTLTEGTLGKATELLYEALLKEGRALAVQDAFIEGADSIYARDENKPDLKKLGQELAVAGYLSNFSTAVALAGTHNEFKNDRVKESGTEYRNTTDMQKRHKHILSPGLANSGASGRTEFRSVTMAETTLNLQEFNNALPDDYQEVEIADAQSYVSLDFYKDILHDHGDLTPEIEEALNKVKAGEVLADAEIKLLRPYKPFYYERVFNPNTGMFQSQQIKNSIIPIIPGISAEFDKMAKWMAGTETRKPIDQIQMASAHKVGQDKPNIELYNKEDGTFNADAEFSEDMVYTLPLTGYRKQVNVTDHWHNDSTNKLASQLEKIVVANAVMNMGDRGREVATEFLSTLGNVYQTQMDKFFGQFELKNGVMNEAKFKDWLLAQLDDGTSPQYVINLIKDGMFTAPAVVGAMRSRVFTGVEQEVNTVRVAGGTQVQISSQFYSTTGEDAVLPRLRGMRTEDGKVVPAEIAVSRDFLPKEYRDMSIEDIKATAPEVLRSITVRIPAESLNSGSVVEVVKFLPKGMDGVVVPDEFVTQMGSDFDVDKLFFQFRADDTKANADINKLFDLQVEVFSAPENLQAVMAPQGFDQLSAAAKAMPFRPAKQDVFIGENPLSVATHGFMRSDNMAGVALKGQAANKNTILLDLIRYGFQFSGGFKHKGKDVSFDGFNVNPNIVRLHAEMVAAAMDGAKDPVYGKLGVNNANFNLFSEILLFTGDLETAVQVVQSKPAQMESLGHIRISSPDRKGAVTVTPLTTKGEKYLEALEGEPGKSLIVQGNFEYKFGDSAFSQKYMLGSLGSWKKMHTNVMRDVNKLMRSDKVVIATGIENQMRKEEPVESNAVFRLGHTFESENLPVMEAVGFMHVKREMDDMFRNTANLLQATGDNYLNILKLGSVLYPKIAENMKMQQYDAYRRQSAAYTARDKATYSAMGERTAVIPSTMPADMADASLEQWVRYYRSNEINNPDLEMVLSKLVLQTNPYNVDGTYFDNFTLVGVSEDSEMVMVSEAMERLDADLEFRQFIDTMSEYEAQRSIYNTSQSRLTRILPSRVQRSIAEGVGAQGKQDIITVNELPDIVRMSAYTNEPKTLPFKLKEAFANADNLKATVYRTTDGYTIFPLQEDEETGVMWGAAKTPNGGKNFAGKQIQAEDIVMPAAEAQTEESRLDGYGPELDAETKISYLKERFKRSGLPVKVIMDSTLPVNGQVRFEAGTATVYIHPDKLQGDTIAHEFGHILVEALGYNNPLVQQAINELRGTELWQEVAEGYSDVLKNDPTKFEKEVLVTWLGRRGNELITKPQGKVSKLRTLYNRIMRAIGKIFGIKPKATEQLAMELMFGDGELSLETKLNDMFEQRGTQTASDIMRTTGQNLKARMEFLARTGGTSVEAQEALDEARKRYQAATGGVIIERLRNIADMTDETIAAAVEATQELDDISKNMATNRTLSEVEVAKLRKADNMLNDLETLMRSLDNMETIKDPETDQEIAFQGLADKIDGLREAKNNLTGAVSDALSNKLKANTSNQKLLQELGDANMFAIVENENLRHLMTDVDAVSKGALGVKEFKNPVTQAIAKLVADTLETARLDAKQDEATISQIVDKFIADGGKLEDIIDVETGAFKGEYSADYYARRREAEKLVANGKNPLALIEFDASNTIQEYVADYYKQWVIPSNRIQTLREKIRRDEGLIKAGFRKKEINERLTENRNEFKKLMQEQADTFMQYHNVETLEGFEAAREEARAKAEAAKAEFKETGKSNPDAFALKNFDTDNVVINVNGRFIPTRGKYAKVEVKDQYKNESYTGSPRPSESFRNASWTNNPHKDVISGLKEAMANAAGLPGQSFVEQGFLPLNYKTMTGKSAAEQLKAEGRKISGAAAQAVGATDETFASQVELDARGNRVYVRNSNLFAAPSAESLEALKGMDLKDIKARLGQFVKDAHQEQAKRTLEPMAYLTREVFEQSEIIDGKHVIKMGQRGKNMREATKLAKGTNIAESLDQWFEGVLGDNWEDSTQYDKMAGLIQQYTSLMGVGLNLPAWINNFGYGSLQRHLEFSTREHFSKENSRKAHRLISSNFSAWMKDLVTEHGGKFDNKASALIHTLDVADDQRELPFNQKESSLSKLVSKAFVGQTMGEIAMQNQVLFALMLETEVTLANGDTTNLYEAYELKDGVLTLPEGATVAGEVLDNKYMARFRNKVKSLNHYVHGAYNKQDAGTWQRHWIGRLGMQFRRWLPMGIKKRFGERVYNESREREEIGDYRAIASILQHVIGDMRKGQKFMDIIRGVKESDPVAYRAAMRGLKEVAIGAALFMAVAALYAFGMDDEEEWGVLTALAVNRTERLAQELHTYAPHGMIKLFADTTKSPFASWGKIGDAGELLLLAGQDGAAAAGLGDYQIYDRGAHKGESKTLRKLEGIVPVFGQAQRFLGIEENHKQYSQLYSWLN